jgi:hypothetical protein
MVDSPFVNGCCGDFILHESGQGPFFYLFPVGVALYVTIRQIQNTIDRKDNGIVYSVTGTIGRNGAGKTTLLDFIEA